MALNAQRLEPFGPFRTTLAVLLRHLNGEGQKYRRARISLRQPRRGRQAFVLMTGKHHDGIRISPAATDDEKISGFCCRANERGQQNESDQRYSASAVSPRRSHRG